MTCKKEKSKWLVALLLCLSCLVLCVTLIAPTKADAAKGYAAVSGLENVYEELNSDGSSQNPKVFVYGSSTTPSQNYLIRLTDELAETTRKYYVPIGGTATTYYLVDNNGALDTDRVKDADAPSAGGDENKYQAAGKTNIYEVLTGAGASKSPKAYVYSNNAKPETSRPIPAYVKGELYYLRLLNDEYIAVAANGSLDCDNVISAGPDKLFNTPDDVTIYPKQQSSATTTTTATTNPTAKQYVPVTGEKNVYEEKNPDGSSQTPKVYLYCSSATPTQYYNIRLIDYAGGKFYIGVGGANTYYYFLKENGTLDTAVVYDAEGKQITITPTTKKYQTAGKTNIYESLTDAGGSKEPREYVYSSINEPQKCLPIALQKKGDAFYLQLQNNEYIAVAADGTLDCNNVIAAGPDKAFNTADDMILYPKGASSDRFLAVTGYKNLFEVVNADGSSKNPKQYVYSTKAEPAQDANRTKAYHATAGADGYYAESPDYGTVYLALKADGTLDKNDAIWAGSDKTFGTADDKKAVWRENAFYYEISSGVWELIYPKGEQPVTTTAVTTTTINGTTTTGVSGATTSSTTADSFFSTTAGSRLPNTGKRTQAGLIVALGVFLSGTVYCGYHLLRKRHN